MAIELECGQCKRHFVVDSSGPGQQATCPSCGHVVAIPAEPRISPSEPAPGEHMFCPKCGQQNPENNFRCLRCAFVLHGPPSPQYVVTDDNTMGGLIPYKNSRALWAYYLGIFSLIPFLGIPLGIAALILGVKGLKNAELHPEVRGKVHAWTGIILGAVCALIYTALIAVPLMMRVFT
jgi:hypothetical protein